MLRLCHLLRTAPPLTSRPRQVHAGRRRTAYIAESAAADTSVASAAASMVLLPAVLCVALTTASTTGHSPPAPAGRQYQYGDRPPPYPAPGHQWYRYSYGGTVDAPPPAATTGYARGFGYTGLSDKPYVTIYNYGSWPRQHGKGHDFGDNSQGYARGYDYGPQKEGLEYVREYYKDRYHHSREEQRENFLPGYGREYSGYRGDQRRPNVPQRGGSTVIVLGSKKAYPSGFPHSGYPGEPSEGFPSGDSRGHSGSYPDRYPEAPGGHYGGRGYRDDQDHGFHYHRDDYPRKQYYEGRKGYYNGRKTHHDGSLSYYGGGGYRSMLRGNGGFPHGGGKS